MARSLDSNMYGADDTSMAESIASDALGNTQGGEDIWGGLKDSRAESRDGAEDPQPGDVKTGPSKQNRSDSRATSRGAE